MKILTVFSPRMVALYVAVFQKLNEKYSDLEVIAIATKPRSQSAGLWIKPKPISALYSWAELENEFMHKQVDPETRDRLIDEYGDEINKIWIADRQLGRAFSAEAIYPFTPLMRHTVGNTDNALNFIFNSIVFHEKVFEIHQPDIVIGGANLVTFFVSRKKNIEYRSICTPRIGNQILLDDNIYDMQTPVATLFKNKKKDRGILAKSRKFIDDVRNKSLQPGYYSAKKPWLETITNKEIIYLSIISAARRKSDDVRKADPWDELKHRFNHLWRHTRITKHLFEKYEPDRLGKFAYFPLHVTPEYTTILLAPEYTNQICVIENLAKAIPPDMQLVVKEHIPMLGRRPRGFYEHLTSIPKVVLIDPEISSHELIKQAEFVSVITGTAGFEALIYGTPLLLFGDPGYTIIGSGFIKARGGKLLREDIEKVLTLDKADEGAILRYVSCVYECSIDIDFSELYTTHTTQSIRDNPEVVEKLVELYSADLERHCSDKKRAKVRSL